MRRDLGRVALCDAREMRREAADAAFLGDARGEAAKRSEAVRLTDMSTRILAAGEYPPPVHWPAPPPAPPPPPAPAPPPPCGPCK
jgi:hypothetical protein